MKPTDGSHDDTISDTATITKAEAREGEPRPSDLLAGYAIGEVIGRGGMGEVVLARDLRIGRDVAIKRLRGASPSDEAIVRFLREAKIQARLDHPAIVPVHELGTDAAGRPYFTMKRLAGVTLEALLEATTESPQRLLRAFVDVALAVELAHSKGIIHRDLKPANIMLGDFGEVYVLDWGLGRVIDEPLEQATAVDTLATPATGLTALGAVLGTPGYMPPEQIRDASTVGTRADSYALGAILFEILTGEPLHPRADPIVSTLEGVDASPNRRRPERAVAPELDNLCVLALATDEAARPTARVLAERVQSYLDGDRDLAMRRGLARESVDVAHRAFAANRHDEAMRAAGRALALDPSSPAAEIVTRLMLEPPEQPSPGLLAELEEAETARTLKQAGKARVMFLSFLPLLGLAIWTGVRSWPLIGSIAALAIVMSFSAFAIAREPARANRNLWAYAVGNATLLALLGRLCSPFLMVPGLVCIVIMSIVVYPAFFRRAWLAISGIVAGWAIPVVLELFALVRPTWEIAGGEFRVRSYAIELDGSETTIFILAGTMATFVTAAILATTTTRANHKAQRQLLTQRWQLKQLIPTLGSVT